MISSQHSYEVRPRKDHRGVDLISDALPFGRLWYGEPNAISNAIGYAKHRSRSHRAVIRVYDDAGNVIETHERWRFQRTLSVRWPKPYWLFMTWSAVPGLLSSRSGRRTMLIAETNYGVFTRYPSVLPQGSCRSPIQTRRQVSYQEELPHRRHRNLDQEVFR